MLVVVNTELRETETDRERGGEREGEKREGEGEREREGGLFLFCSEYQNLSSNSKVRTFQNGKDC